MTEPGALCVGITGGGGFIGQALARSFAADGHRVTGLDLNDSAKSVYEALGATLVVGDMTDPVSARAFCGGVDLIIHTAAIVEESGSWQRFERINIGGTATMLDAARRSGVRAFIHFSSVMVYGFEYPDRVTEDGPVDGAGNPYCTTKITAEQLAQVANDTGSFDVFIIRPGDVYGPGSVPWLIRPVEQLKSGTFAYLDKKSAVINHVYVDNLVDGVKVVWQRGNPGEAYCITDGQRTLAATFFGNYQRFLGINKVPSIPGRLALVVASLLGPLAGRIGINRETVRYLRRTGVYSCDKVRALGYEPRVTLAEGMELSRAWLETAGHLGAHSADPPRRVMTDHHAIED